MQDCRIFQLMVTITVHVARWFWPLIFWCRFTLDRLRITLSNRDRTRLHETFIITIKSLKMEENKFFFTWINMDIYFWRRSGSFWLLKWIGMFSPILLLRIDPIFRIPMLIRICTIQINMFFSVSSISIFWRRTALFICCIRFGHKCIAGGFRYWKWEVFHQQKDSMLL